jgi:hypothetical protein
VNADYVFGVCLSLMGLFLYICLASLVYFEAVKEGLKQSRINVFLFAIWPVTLFVFTVGAVIHVIFRGFKDLISYWRGLPWR